MMIKKISILSIGLSLLLMISCDKDDNNDPSGTIILNMMNEENGKTNIGKTDIYIDNANNFVSYQYQIAFLGKKNGLESLSVPVLDGLNSKVAIEQGNAYQIFDRRDLHEFPSGKLALYKNAEYINVYVISFIKESDNITGSNVKFVLMHAPSHGLPEYKDIGTLYFNDQNVRELTLEFPTPDFEYEPAFHNSSYTLECEKKDNKLTVRLISFQSENEFGFYIRIQNSYTYLQGRIERYKQN